MSIRIIRLLLIFSSLVIIITACNNGKSQNQQLSTDVIETYLAKLNETDIGNLDTPESIRREIKNIKPTEINQAIDFGFIFKSTGCGGDPNIVWDTNKKQLFWKPDEVFLTYSLPLKYDESEIIFNKVMEIDYFSITIIGMELSGINNCHAVPESKYTLLVKNGSLENEVIWSGTPSFCKDHEYEHNLPQLLWMIEEKIINFMIINDLPRTTHPCL